MLVALQSCTVSVHFRHKIKSATLSDVSNVRIQILKKKENEIQFKNCQNESGGMYSFLSQTLTLQS